LISEQTLFNKYLYLTHKGIHINLVDPLYFIIRCQMSSDPLQMPLGPADAFIKSEQGPHKGPQLTCERLKPS